MRQSLKLSLLERHPAVRVWFFNEDGIKSQKTFFDYPYRNSFLAMCTTHPNMDPRAIYASLVLSSISNRLTVNSIPLEDYIGFELLDEEGKSIYSTPILDLFFLYDNLVWQPMEILPATFDFNYSYVFDKHQQSSTRKRDIVCKSEDLLKKMEVEFKKLLHKSATTRHLESCEIYKVETDVGSTAIYCREFTNSFDFKLDEFLFGEAKYCDPGIQRHDSHSAFVNICNKVGFYETGTEKTYAAPSVSNVTPGHWKFVLSLRGTQ